MSFREKKCFFLAFYRIVGIQEKTSGTCFRDEPYMKTKIISQLVGIGPRVLFAFRLYFAQKYNFSYIRPMKIVCLGDSITSGFKLPAPEKSSFPSQLEKMSGNKWKITNAGMTGATALKEGDISIWTSPAFSLIEKIQPDVVVLMLGSNDTKDINWPHISSFEIDYCNIVRHIKQQPVHPELLLCSVPPVEGFNLFGISDDRVTELSGLVRKIAKATNTQYVDVTSSLRGKPEKFIDGLHPNKEGAKIIANILMKSIIQTQKSAPISVS